jgi:hypothetical protein
MISGSRSENIFFGCVEVKLSHVLFQIEVVNVFFTGNSLLAISSDGHHLYFQSRTQLWL